MTGDDDNHKDRAEAVVDRILEFKREVQSAEIVSLKAV